MEQPRTELRRTRRGGWLAGALVLAAVAAGAAYWWFGREPGSPPPPEPAPTSAPAAEPAAPAEAATPGETKSLLESVSANPLYRRGVSGADAVRSWAAVTDNLAEGESPRKPLDFLAPGEPFSAVVRDGHSFVSPASYARYNAFADAVASVDVQAAARAYRTLHGAAEAAYRALGYPDGSLDRATARALGRLVATPVPAGEVELVDDGGLFLFADPKLEDLSDVEKHLLRMGPRNERLIQAKARDLLTALGLAEAAGR